MASDASPRTAALSLAALGIVFGDIGTSPLYAIRESLEGPGHVLDVSSTNVLGVLSLIFWSLLVVVTIKYLLVVMRADNDGEGGILSLTALIGGDHARRRRYALILVGLFGTALLYGDGMITPAISVLSAVEGTTLISSGSDRWVIPISVGILIGLFAIQRRGTGSIGRVFGPIMVVWFATLAILGAAQVVANPGVFRALNPVYGAEFFVQNGFKGFLTLGSVFLVVTGGEALYADMGHFGRAPIQLGWFALVLPALLLNYFGQGALLLADPAAIENPFYRLVPEAGVLPLVVLATVATVIASQALISGVFSLTRQAVQLGYAPRLRINHTSETEIGQIYVPAINWALMVSCIGLVVGFRSSTSLAAAYGVAVTLTMVITTVLFYVVARGRFGWSLRRAAGACGVFAAIDLAFFGANVFKIPHGGWFPLVIGAVVFTLLTTWRTGRSILGARIRRAEVPLDRFLASAFADEPPTRVPQTGVFLFSVPDMTPPSLLANLRHNHVLHEQTVVVAVVTEPVPRVLPVQRSQLRALGHGVHHVVLHYGYMEDPDVPTGLGQGQAAKLGIVADQATFFLGTESLLISRHPGMAIWRERLFALMSRNATTASNYFGLPPERTATVGVSVEL